MSIANNYIGFGAYGPYYYTTTRVASVVGNTIVDFTNPTPSILAQAAYQAAGVPTANVVSATTSNVWAIASGSKPTTIFGNGIVGEDLQAGAGETNFVGGAGGQHLYGGQGAIILTYLAMSDGGDTAAGFIGQGRDRFSLIDATHHGRCPELHFHRLGRIHWRRRRGALSAGSDEDVTYVQVTLAGDRVADLRITLMGLLCLTAADFALTSAESSARWRPAR